MRRIEGGLRRTKMLLRTMGFSESGIWSYDALDGIENWILWLLYTCGIENHVYRMEVREGTGVDTGLLESSASSIAREHLI